MIVYPVDRSRRPPVLFLSCIVGIYLIFIMLYALVSQPAWPELQRFAMVFGLVAVLAALIGILGFYLGGFRRLSGLLAGNWRAYMLAGVTVFLMTAIAAGIVFESTYYLVLALLVTAYAVAILMALAYLQFAVYRQNLQRLMAAAENLAQGRYHVAVELTDRDELARLGVIFNDMAAKMERVDQKERHLDRLRLDLTNWIGYDLRIPLTSVRNIVEALDDDLVEDPRTYRRYLSTVRRDVNMLSDLIDDMHDMARLETVGIRISRRPTDIGALIEETIAGLSDMADEMGVTLSGGVTSEVKWIDADGFQLGRALNNLIGHALRRTPQGGSVRVYAYAVSGGVLIEIVDIYQGARSSEIDHLQELFYSENDVHGTASDRVRLGLAMAKTIVQAHGSKLRVENTANQGMRVMFTLTEEASTFARGM